MKTLIIIIIGLLLLQSCERVENITGTPESNEPTVINCSHVVISSGSEESLEITEYRLSGTESNLDTYESGYLWACVSIDSIAITDSEIYAITELTLNVGDSLLLINNNKVVSAKNKRINWIKK